MARDVADSPDVLRFLTSLPPQRRQPNLLLGAATLILGRPPDIALLSDMVAGRAAELRATMLSRTTQTTNRPAAPPCCRRWPGFAQPPAFVF